MTARDDAYAALVIPWQAFAALLRRGYQDARRGGPGVVVARMEWEWTAYAAGYHYGLRHEV